MERPKSVVYVIISTIICLVVAIATTWGVGRLTSANTLYGSSTPKKIGVTYMTYNNPFYTVINEELTKIVEDNGDTLITLDPALSLKKQKKQMESLIEKKVDLIVLTPVDFEGLEPMIKKAYKANIPVVVVDTNVKSSKYITYSVVSDNYNAGVQCAQDMIKNLDSAKIVLLEHSTANSAYLRIQGFKDTIEKYSEYEIVEEIECHGQLEIAMPKMESFLDEGKDFNVVMCLNDPSALGAMAALEEKNELDGVFVYGVDGTPETKKLISEGKMQATVAQYPKKMGEEIGEVIYKIFNNEQLDGAEDIMDVQIITKENISEFSLEGWQ